MHFFQGVSIVRIGGQDDNCRGSVWIIFHSVTFIDHTSRSVFKGSELEKGLSASTFNDLMQERWKTDGNSTVESVPSGASATVTDRKTFNENVGAEVAAMIMESLMDSRRKNESPEANRKKKRKRRM